MDVCTHLRAFLFICAMRLVYVCISLIVVWCVGEAIWTRLVGEIGLGGGGGGGRGMPYSMVCGTMEMCVCVWVGGCEANVILSLSVGMGGVQQGGM